VLRVAALATVAIVAGVVGLATLSGGPPGPATVAPATVAPATVAPATVAVASDVGRRALAAAQSQVGTPYVFGAARPGVGFDCSGLVWWAYREVGVVLPRVTFDQVHAGVPVALDELAPGDLVFTRGGDPPTDFGHVSLYAGDGIVVMAPHTGDVVRRQRLDLALVQAARRIGA